MRNPTQPASAANAFTSDAQLMEDYLQSAGILVNIQGGGAGQVAAFRNAQGQAEAIVIDPNNVVFHVCREPLSDSGWNMYGIGAGFSAIAAIDAATVWACGTQGDIWRGDHGRWRRTGVLGSGDAAIGVSAGVDGTVWATDTAGMLFVLGETTLEPAPVVNPAIAPALVVDSAGLLNCFCIDADGALWTVRQRVVGGSWAVWRNLSTPSANVTATTLVVAANADGRLQVFTAGSDAALHTIWQRRPGGDWSAWGSVAAQDPAIATLVAAENHDGRIELFVLTQPDPSGNVTLSHIWQTVPNGDWSAWTVFDQPWPQVVSGIAVVRDTTGSLQLVLLSRLDLECLSAKQATPGGDWTSWQTMGAGMPAVEGTPALAVDACGDLVLFVVDGSTGLSILGQVDGRWNDNWLLLGSPLGRGFALGSPTVARNADGRLEAFVQGAGWVFHLWQTAPGGSWSSWANLGQPNGQVLDTLAVALNGAGALELVALGGTTSWHTGYDNLFAGGWMPWVGDWWTWFPMAGGSRLTAMPAGRAGDFWGIASGGLARWNGQAWSITALPDGLSAACMTVDAEGTVWLLCTDAPGTLLRLIDGAFDVQPAALPGATSISARDGAGIWATGAGAKGGVELHVLRGAAWVGAGTPHLFNLNWNNTAQVSVGADSAVWLLDGSRNAWRQSMTPASWRWDAFAPPTSTMRFVSAARGGNAWGVAGDGSVWQFKGSWRPFAPALPSGAIAQISTGAPGTLWAIDQAGVPYAYGGSGGWTSIQDQFFGPLLQSPTTWAIAPMAAFQYQVEPVSGAGTWAAVQTWSQFTATQLSVGADGTVVVLDTTGALHVFSTAPPWVASAPANLIQIAAVDATRAWAIARDPATKASTLHLYRDGAWEIVTTSQELLASTATAPHLSSAGDGTVWLLATDGVPRRLEWSGRVTSWIAKPAPAAMAAIAAANVDEATINAPQQQRAWATTADGALRRNDGDGGPWLDTHTALPRGAAAAQVSVGADGSMWAIDTAGALYRRQTWNQSPASSDDGPESIAAVLDSAGTLLLFTLDAGGAAWFTSKRSGAATWDDWQALPASPQSLTGIVASTAQDGLGRVVGLTGAGVAMICAERSAAPTTWNPFTRLGPGGQPAGVTLVGLSTGRDAMNRLHVFGLGADGGVWTIAESSSGAWTTWTSMAAGAARFAALGGTGQAASGALEVFALDQSGAAYRSVYQQAGAGTWSAWRSIGAAGLPTGVTVRGLAVGNQRGGPLYVIAIGSDDRLYASSEQAASSSGWSAWNDIGAIAGVEPQSLATATGADGVFTVFMRGGDGAIHAATLTQGWSAWAPLGAIGASDTLMQALVAPSDATGTVHVVAGGGGTVWRTVPASISPTGWSDWSGLSGAQSWQPVATPAALAQAPVGAVAALWAVFEDGSIRRSGAGGAWQPIAFPTAAAPQKAVAVSVGVDGVVWAISATACHRMNPSTGAWTLAGNGSFAQAPVGRASDLWTVDARGAVWRSANDGATWWQDASAPGPMRQVSACADGSIWGVDFDGAAWLAAAWRRIMRPTGMPGFATATGATAVAAGQDENETRYLFLVADGALFCTYELAHHAWLAPSQISPSGLSIAGITTTNQQDTGELVVYGTSVGYAITVATKVAGERYQFASSTIGAWIDSNKADPFTGTSFELVAIDAQTWLWLGVANGSLYSATTAANPPGVILAPVVPSQSFTAAAVLPLPWRRDPASPFCAVIDDSSRLWLVGEIQMEPGGPSTATSLPLTGSGSALAGGASSYAAILQQDTWAPPQQRLYAMADTAAGDAALWMLGRANLFGSIVSPDAWGAWTPLGDDFVGLFNGPALAPVDTLFAIDSGTSSLAALRQNPTTGAWSDGVVKRPSQAPDQIVSIATYQTEATLLDGNGIPMARAAVTIFADSPVDGWVNNTLHALDPVHGVTVRTDDLGRVVVRTIATRLDAPQLTLAPVAPPGGVRAAPGAGLGDAGATIAPSQRVYSFLQGQGKLPIGAGQPTNLTAAGIQSLNPNLDGPTAQSAVDDINKIATVGGASAMAAQPWRIRDDRAIGEPGSVFGDAWDHLKHAGEAIVHAVEKGIVKAVVSLDGDIVTITIRIGDEVVAALKSAIRSVEDAVRAIEVLVRSIVAEIKAFIDWLRLVFDWNNILATQDAMIAFIEQGMELLQGRITALEGKVATFFDGIQGSLDSAFASITSGGDIGGFGAFASLPSTVPPSGVGDASTGGVVPAQPVSGASHVHQNWFVRKVLDHVTPAFALPAIDGVDASTLLDHLDVENAIGKISDAAQDLRRFFSTLFAHPSEFAQQGIVDLLQAAKALLDAVIEFVEDLIEAFLALAQAILAGLVDMLDTKVHIPLIDTLFQLIDRRPMTLMNVGTLAVAAPMYIVFETIYPGADPPFQGLGGAGAAADAGAPPQGTWTPAQQWAGGFLALGLVNWFWTGASDIETIVATPEVDPKRVPVFGPALVLIHSMVGLMMRISAWPGPNGFPNLPATAPTAAEVAIWFNSALLWGPPLFALAGSGTTALGGDVKQVVRTIIGGAGLVSGVVAAIEGLAAPKPISGETAVQLVITPIGLALSWLLVSEVRQGIWASSEETFDPAWIIFVVNLIDNLAAPILHEVSAMAER